MQDNGSLQIDRKGNALGKFVLMVIGVDGDMVLTVIDSGADRCWW